jgi:hypothetical protein
MSTAPMAQVRLARGYPLARQTAAAALLAAACVAWSALPMRTAGSLGTPVLVLAIGCAVLGTARPAAGRGQDAPGIYHSAPARIGLALVAALRAIPWNEGMVIAVLVLEALHPSRPYHTALLAVALLAFIFAAHLAESVARPGALRPQLPLIAAGLGLLVIATGASLLPAPAGPASGWLRVLAVIAALLAGCLALPI